MRRSAILVVLLLPGAVQAGIYTHVDPDSGMTVISNIASGPATAARRSRMVTQAVRPAPADFPRMSKDRQRELDDGRRTILDTELAAEQQALSTAAARRAEAAVLHRHQTNIEALKRELKAMR